LQHNNDEEKQAVAVVESVLKDNEKNHEDLIPIIQKIQQKLGYLPETAMEIIATKVGIPSVDIFGLATFYNQFRLQPPGKNQVKVCLGTACYMVGGDITMESFERKMEIKEGETSADRIYSLERVACVGCCTLAPVVVVNDKVEGKVTPTRVDGIMLELTSGTEAEEGGGE